MEQHFSEFQGKRTTLRGIPKFLEFSVTFFLKNGRNFRLIDWFAFQRFNDLRVFWKLSQEISVWLNGKRPSYIDYNCSVLLCFLDRFLDYGEESWKNEARGSLKDLNTWVLWITWTYVLLLVSHFLANDKPGNTLSRSPWIARAVGCSLIGSKGLLYLIN